ncbi:cyclic nucleotide-binding domain-containing protein 1-like isoform X1 [Ruditapes philippinarum]|uniref:cyclic nucleotide-binding domain-containing protein 1-like isoform X1 n=1 Tax=Ruditapes philippinarum TaxID=129788 RepID=UPI00295A7FAD|nr:cyclic nucleotide-binding domain-containing protein 1-like isoform X1 [Ruditapes philippinarum]XP_060587737.1 cyclic nucleotide-binding domain-containing protein 1-like isoform X1 [Ruditapes philippinarum]
MNKCSADWQNKEKMALMKRRDMAIRPFHSADARNTSFKLPKLEKPPAIDYDKLRELCSIDGLKDVQNGVSQTSDEAHETFMQSYKSVFVQKPKKLGFPIHSEQREQLKSSMLSITHNATGKTMESDKKKVKKEWPIDKITHDIRDYMPLLHKQRKTKNPALIREQNIKTLRRLSRKLPFQRTASDNDEIFNILRTISFFKENVPEHILKELCVVAVHETWKDPEFTIFGNTGLHLVLNGIVNPVTKPWLNEDDGQSLRTPTPLSDLSTTEIKVGQCFGTLRKVDGRGASSKVYSVVTADNNCEFLKIPSADYARVIEQIKQREHTEKVNLLLSCGQYKLWPRQPLLQVAELIEWISYPPNTVIVSEGYMAPFIGFIKTGECHILRMVEVMHTLSNGKREKRTKQVVMGRLGASESFAELSVLLNEQITCSVVTATEMTLGVIRPEKIKDLDEVTIQLFKQSNNRTFGDLTKDDIQEEYMQQELKREWNEFKHGVLLDVINSRGIRPGYGKWSK